MERGLYIAATGMLAEQARQDKLANDLANVNTAGYKQDRVTQRSFGELMLQNTREGGGGIGGLDLGPVVTGQTTDYASQPIERTDEPLDMAIQGQGWFGVQTPQGTRYTRNGAFQAGAGGTLTDQMGNPVLGQGRQPVKLKADGTVDAAQVGLFNVPNPKKQGDSLVTGVARGDAAGKIQTGGLESSGVDSTRTMIQMMTSMRVYEAGQKALTTIDETLKQASSQVGSLNG